MGGVDAVGGYSRRRGEPEGVDGKRIIGKASRPCTAMPTGVSIGLQQRPGVYP